jgi:hypothetical protein
MSTEQEWMEQERDEADQVQMALEHLQEVEARSDSPEKEYQLWQASVDLNSAEMAQQIGKLARRVALLEKDQAAVAELHTMLVQAGFAPATTSPQDA